MSSKSNYAVDLAKAIIDLELLKKDALSGNIFNNRLCHCKVIIIENYLSVCQLFYIRVTSKVIRYVEDLHNGKLDINDSILREKIFGFTTLKEWFKYYAYNKLCSFEYVSKKILVIFKKIQSVIDDALFSYFENEYKKFINGIVTDTNEINEDILYKSLKDLYLSMRNWFETSVFNIIGINVDCNNIKDCIFDELELIDEQEKIVTKDFCLQRCLDKELNVNLECDKFCKINCKNGKCITHEYIHNNKEFIHLIVLPEMLERGNESFTNYINTFRKYHVNPKSVDFIVDYTLMDNDYKWDNNTLYRLNLLIDTFDNIYVINHEHIDKSQIIDQLYDKIIFDNIPDYFDLNINDLKFDKEKEQNKNN